MDAQIIMEQTKKAPKRRATEQAVIATPAKTPDGGGMTARQMGDRSLLGSEAWENIDRTVNAIMARFTAGSLC